VIDGAGKLRRRTALRAAFTVAGVAALELYFSVIRFFEAINPKARHPRHHGWHPQLRKFTPIQSRVVLLFFCVMLCDVMSVVLNSAMLNGVSPYRWHQWV
jgi:hypothetical protein